MNGRSRSPPMLPFMNGGHGLSGKHTPRIKLPHEEARLAMSSRPLRRLWMRILVVIGFFFGLVVLMRRSEETQETTWTQSKHVVPNRANFIAGVSSETSPQPTKAPGSTGHGLFGWLWPQRTLREQFVPEGFEATNGRLRWHVWRSAENKKKYSVPSLRETITNQAFSDECVERYIADGVLCRQLKNAWTGNPYALDAVWTWQNGTDRWVERWRRTLYALQVGETPRKFAGATEHHAFRDHDELRYSVRSVQEAFRNDPHAIRQAHVIVNDVPSDVMPENAIFADLGREQSERMMQVPQWLNPSSVAVYNAETRSQVNKLVAAFESSVKDFIAAHGTPAVAPPKFGDLPPGEVGIANEGGGVQKRGAPDTASSDEASRMVKRAVAGTQKLKNWAYGSGNALDALPHKINIHPHWDIFRPASKSVTDVHEWKMHVLPSFNSRAIESQLSNVPNAGDTILYMNDDFFLQGDFAVTDFASPLTGPMLLVQKDLEVDFADPASYVGRGEWSGLRVGNFYLSKRFGFNLASYPLHQAKVVPVALLQEARRMFSQEFDATASTMFRGQSSYELQPAFFLQTFIIQRHREALLWSYFVAKMDVNQDGKYSLHERKWILNDLGGDRIKKHGSLSANRNIKLRFAAPKRVPQADNLAYMYKQTGLAPPRQIKLGFSSMDGYAQFYSPYLGERRTRLWPSFASKRAKSQGPDFAADNETPACTLDLSSCFGYDFFASGPTDVNSIVKRVAFLEPQCGDCIIVRLLKKSGAQGLSAFLPDPDMPTDPNFVPHREGEDLMMDNEVRRKSFKDKSFREKFGLHKRLAKRQDGDFDADIPPNANVMEDFVEKLSDSEDLAHLDFGAAPSDWDPSDTGADDPYSENTSSRVEKSAFDKDGNPLSLEDDAAQRSEGEAGIISTLEDESEDAVPPSLEDAARWESDARPKMYNAEEDSSDPSAGDIAEQHSSSRHAAVQLDDATSAAIEHGADAADDASADSSDESTPSADEEASVPEQQEQEEPPAESQEDQETKQLAEQDAELQAEEAPEPGQEGPSTKLDTAKPSVMEDHVYVLSLESNFNNVYYEPLPHLSVQERRIRAARLIHRYSYTLGEVTSALVQMKYTRTLRRQLALLNRKRPLPALVAINDDIADAADHRVDAMDSSLKSWLALRHPHPSIYETVQV